MTRFPGEILIKSLLLFVIALLGGCNRGSDQTLTAAQTQDAWRDHLADYTQGWVGAEQPLVFRFTHPVIDAKQLNKPLDGIVHIEPAQDAVAVFTAEDTMEVRHPQRFAAGSTFTITVKPGKLKGLPATLPALRHELHVLEQGINLREIGLVAHPGNDEQLLLEGSLETSDSADPQAVEKVLSATHGSNVLAIAWKHVDAREHRFTVQGIVRGAAASEVLVRWDGAALAVTSKGERAVAIPPLAAFTLTSARGVVQPDAHIALHFSQMLDAAQDFTGIVQLNGANARTQLDGSVLRAYASGRLSGEVTVRVAEGLRSARGATLGEAVEQKLTFAAELPAVRFAEQGHILPAAERITIPFEAVAVKAVHVRAFEVPAANIGQYLQNSGLDFAGRRYADDYSHRAVGRYLWQKTLVLPEVPVADWKRFDLDVGELVANKKGSLIRLELVVLPQDSAYACDTAPVAQPEQDAEKLSFNGFDQASNVPEHLRAFYESAGYYEWDQRDNPCHVAYYSNHENTLVSQMFFASSIGLLAKQGSDRELHVLVSDLRAGKPLSGAAVTVFNFQRQRIGSGNSGSDGLMTIAVEGVPFYLMAEKGGDTAYLKVPRNASLPTSQFDTGGARPQDGLKGFFYGERDIWRPGDDIYLTFILQDRDDRLPANYPVTVEFLRSAR